MFDSLNRIITLAVKKKLINKKQALVKKKNSLRLNLRKSKIFTSLMYN